MSINNLNFSEKEKLQIDSIVKLIKKEYKENLVGLYLFGSSVQGGLKKNSDLDFLTITKSSLGLETRKSLTKNLMKLSKKINEKSCYRYVELTNLIEDDIKSWSHPSNHDYLYGEWLRSDFEKGRVPLRELNSDLTIVLYQAKKNNLELLENSISLPDIDQLDLRRAMKEVLPDIINDAGGDESNAILTLCRIQYSLQKGEIVSKDVAGNYMKRSLNESDQQLIEVAINEYVDGVKGKYDKNELSKLIEKLSNLD